MAEVIVGLLAIGSAALAALTSYRNGKKINEVHILVNSRLDTALDRIDSLTEALEASDTAVPPEHGRVPERH